jgi:hypothetical protein
MRTNVLPFSLSKGRVAHVRKRNMNDKFNRMVTITRHAPFHSKNVNDEQSLSRDYATVIAWSRLSSILAIGTINGNVILYDMTTNQ